MACPKSSPHPSPFVLQRPEQETLNLLALIIERTKSKNKWEYDDKSEEREHIVLDAELDGSHYLLVRLPRTQQAPIVLSPRELEIVRMVAQGHPNKVIADVLNISSWTVCTHLRRVFSKLGVCSRAAMIARVLENGKTAEQFCLGSISVNESTTRKVVKAAREEQSSRTLAVPTLGCSRR
jgi:two-component system, NarL family, nitrate/nitrite response regulator NarL